MHNSKGNAVMAKNAGSVQFQGNAFLLQGSDQSSTCLNCHSGATMGGMTIMTYPLVAAGLPPAQRTPGGDFAWLKITGATSGDRHGHNVIANDFGLGSDGSLQKAPGGDYPNTSLSCVSCHDPHSRARIVDAAGTIQHSSLGGTTLPIKASGSYGVMPTATEAVGVYRLLASKNYSQLSLTQANIVTTPFAADPPIAVAPSTYNRTESATDTRVAYGSGMSEWCSNCHVKIHNDTTNTNNSALIHPAGNGAKLGTAAANDLNGGQSKFISDIYNAYKSSGDLSGAQTSSFTSLVPFEEGSSDRAALALHAVNDGSVKGGPTTGSENVMCLSCHRAHASGFDQMGRWNLSGEFVTVNASWPGTDSTNSDANAKKSSIAAGLTVAQYTGAMYDRPVGNFATYNRSLCNKCHAKD
jgi:hypothetical protein